MIRTFKHAGLKKYFVTGNPKSIRPDMVPRIRRLLNALDAATKLGDTNLPGFGFHPLKGNRKGEYALTVTGNYRLTFKFVNGHVEDLNLEDYH